MQREPKGLKLGLGGGEAGEAGREVGVRGGGGVVVRRRQWKLKMRGDGKEPGV